MSTTMPTSTPTEEDLRARLSGVLICEFVDADVRGFATELFVGVRRTAEFGPIITAGLGGVEMETLAKETRKGAAVAIAPTGLVDGPQFLELFKRTLSYQRLSGAMRGSSRLVTDDVLVECFQAVISLANHFSELNPYADFELIEFEVNPFTVSQSRLAPLDGVCVFGPAHPVVAARPIAKISHLLKPESAAIIGVSGQSMNMGRIILAQHHRRRFRQDAGPLSSAPAPTRSTVSPASPPSAISLRRSISSSSPWAPLRCPRSSKNSSTTMRRTR